MIYDEFNPTILSQDDDDMDGLGDEDVEESEESTDDDSGDDEDSEME